MKKKYTKGNYKNVTPSLDPNNIPLVELNSRWINSLLTTLRLELYVYLKRIIIKPWKGPDILYYSRVRKEFCEVARNPGGMSTEYIHVSLKEYLKFDVTLHKYVINIEKVNSLMNTIKWEETIRNSIK